MLFLTGALNGRRLLQTLYRFLYRDTRNVIPIFALRKVMAMIFLDSLVATVKGCEPLLNYGCSIP